jgi:hypothetical protein
MEKLHLINNTYQVWERGTLWFQGSEEECDAYIQMNGFVKIPELSDEEIDAAAEEYYDGWGYDTAFIEGMKHYRELIKQRQ